MDIEDVVGKDVAMQLAVIAAMDIAVIVETLRLMRDAWESGNGYIQGISKVPLDLEHLYLFAIADNDSIFIAEYEEPRECGEVLVVEDKGDGDAFIKTSEHDMFRIRVW